MIKTSHDNKIGRIDRRVCDNSSDALPPCLYCELTGFHPRVCPAYDKQCYKCQTFDHFAKACWSKNYRFNENIEQKSDITESLDDKFLSHTVGHIQIKKVENMDEDGDKNIHIEIVTESATENMIQNLKKTTTTKKKKKSS